MLRFAFICVITLLVSYAAGAQRRNENGLVSRKRFTFLLGAVSYGSFIMPNTKLNDWIVKNGGNPHQPKFRSEFFRVSLTDQTWVLGLGLSVAASGGANSQNIVDCDFSVGRRLYHKGIFTAIVNSKFGFLIDRINGVVPPSITAPHANSRLEGFGFSAGGSFQTLIRIRQGRKVSMYFGSEFGIAWITHDTWQYGYNTPGYKKAHFNGVDVPEVPRLNNNYSYLNFSLSLGWH